MGWSLVTSQECHQGPGHVIAVSAFLTLNNHQTSSGDVCKIVILTFDVAKQRADAGLMRGMDAVQQQSMSMPWMQSNSSRHYMLR